MCRILMILAVAAMLAAGLADLPAMAQEQPKAEQQCLSYDSAYENALLFAVATNSGDSRVWLYRQTQLCPKG